MEKTRKLISWFCVIAVLIGIAPMLLSQSQASVYAKGDTIEFGSYPQTHITDETLVADLTAVGSNIAWSSYGYNVNGGADFAFYKDVILDNVKYRAVRFSMYRYAFGFGTTEDYGLQSARGYVTNTVHWFRFDPITWTVLDPEEGLLIANVILDSQAINDREYRKENSNISYCDPSYQYYLNDYAHSTIRNWLNNTFSETAFSERETSILAPKMLTDATADMPEGFDSFSYPSTEDAVFLLSYAEAMNTNYFENKSFRSRRGTDYARAQGVNNYNDSNPFDFWFLRSPGDRSNHQTHVNLTGNCLMDSADSNGNDIGICPAIYISLDSYSQLWETGQETSEPSSEPETETITEPDPTEPITEPYTPPADPYENLLFSFDNGILTVSGTGEIPTVENAADAPFAPYAEECKVIVISDGIETVKQNAFSGFDQLEMLILNGSVALEADSFTSNRNLQTVICADHIQYSEASFADGNNVTIYEPKTAPHSGALSNNCVFLPYSFAEGTLYIDGDAEMDVYSLLDLMAVMCGYFDDIHAVHFESYSSLDMPFYIYDKKAGDYVLSESNTLNGVNFSVKVSGENDWEPITFNEFCELAADNDLGIFHLVIDTENEEEIQESAFQIMLNNIQNGMKKVLKWIVGLLNQLFNILSKFKTN